MSTIRAPSGVSTLQTAERTFSTEMKDRSSVASCTGCLYNAEQDCHMLHRFF